MFVHIMGTTLYTKDFYRFINGSFNGSEHCFVNGVPQSEQFRLKSAKHADVSQRALVINAKNLFRYMRALNKCDGIILHGAFTFKHLMVLSLKRKWLQKTCWIIWGGDIYCHRKKQTRLLDRIAEKLRQYCAPKFGFIATLVEKDHALAQEWYHVKGQLFKLVYPVPLQRTGVLERLENIGSIKKADPNHTVNILLGNSATETNCHFEALQILSRFSGEDIRLYLPLNYGFNGYARYAQSVIQKAIEIFGSDKVIPITERMDGEAYSDLLSTMDVAVFYNDRHQGTGNIAILLSCGAKVYIRNDTNMWSHYVNRGFKLCNAYEIHTESFEQFLCYDEKTKKQNMLQIRKGVDGAAIRVRWGLLFDVMLGLTQYTQPIWLD